jgi:hypothetical protein
MRGEMVRWHLRRYRGVVRPDRSPLPVLMGAFVTVDRRLFVATGGDSAWASASLMSLDGGGIGRADWADAGHRPGGGGDTARPVDPVSREVSVRMMERVTVRG